MRNSGLLFEKPWRRSQRRWVVALAAYGLALSAVLGVLAERRWGWLPVWARGTGPMEEAPVPRGLERMPAAGMSSRWSEEAVARGWAAGGMQPGYFPGAEELNQELVAPFTPGPLPPAPVPAEPESTLGPSLGDLKVLNVEVPDFNKLGKR